MGKKIFSTVSMVFLLVLGFGVVVPQPTQANHTETCNVGSIESIQRCIENERESELESCEQESSPEEREECIDDVNTHYSPEESESGDSSTPVIGGSCESGGFFGLPPWYKNFDVVFTDTDDTNENGKRDPGEGCSVQMPTNPDGTTDIGAAAAGIGLAVFEILLRIAGIVAVVFVIVGGFQFITSTGEPEKAKNARGTILNAVIGLIITLIAAPLVSFIASKLI